MILASPSLLDTAGREAGRIAGVWWLMFWLAVGVYAVVAAFIIVALLRRRASLPENRFIVGGGIVVPAVILGVLAVATVATARDLRPARDGALRIRVTGERWWWGVQYPGGVTTANEIHVPVGRPVHVDLRSHNVIHSFWVPQVHGKVDLIPGDPTSIDFTVERAGVYRGECAEFCGVQHANMNFVLVAEPASRFEAWLARYRSIDTSTSGRTVFERLACAGCHTIRGTAAHGTVGPNLTDVGRREWIGAGVTRNTPGNLADWIRDAQQLKPGALMPPIDVSPSELRALVAYLEGLK